MRNPLPCMAGDDVDVDEQLVCYRSELECTCIIDGLGYGQGFRPMGIIKLKVI